MEKAAIEKNVSAVLIGGSAGSLEALLQLLPLIETPCAFPIIIVLHRRIANEEILVDLLASRTKMPVKEVDEKEPVLPGTLYIAPADYHLLFEEDRTFSLDYSERVHYSRPSIDVAFSSAADVYGSGLVCILLSGANSDGTEGMQCAQRAHGLTIAQRPDTAEVAFMPRYAAEAGAADQVLAVEEIAVLLNQKIKETL